jgi:hypothetical protein
LIFHIRAKQPAKIIYMQRKSKREAKEFICSYQFCAKENHKDIV